MSSARMQPFPLNDFSPITQSYMNFTPSIWWGRKWLHHKSKKVNVIQYRLRSGWEKRNKEYRASSGSTTTCILLNGKERRKKSSDLWLDFNSNEVEYQNEYVLYVCMRQKKEEWVNEWVSMHGCVVLFTKNIFGFKENNSSGSIWRKEWLHKSCCSRNSSFERRNKTCWFSCSC